ncbi:DNA-3-methyladenine glycosylase family protein [Clostridium tarantellae]|uniref:DNA-(apurinic or apyrimidinic site) lyase n=1 Tax=Clostridium tarantellae TaxID=39493 RepID=A0A6I1MK74_9CLOT|nr:DNA glycosylase [Clostridium tarantellae]MPQ43926.1 8-oxoguanine DNA glycosylase [Clostridium tarantellae]
MDFENIEYYNNKVILKNTKNFNIKQTFECGQCFRWEKVNDNDFIGVAYGKVIEVEQKNDIIIIYNTNEEDFNNIWLKYFDLKRDYSKIKEELSKDQLLESSVEYGYGIRLLNQEPFELVISFIISARNSIPVISKTIKNISEKWGNSIEYKGKIYYAFPTIEQLSHANLEEIQSTGASFRSKYIYDTVKNIYNCELAKKGELQSNKLEEIEMILNKYDLDKIAKMNDDDCHKALQEFMGIGAKVADCIMLFSMNKYSAFPVDVWVKRAMMHFYGAEDSSLNKIRIFARNRFGEISGFAQQYLFYYARENNIKV